MVDLGGIRGVLGGGGWLDSGVVMLLHYVNSIIGGDDACPLGLLFCVNLCPNLFAFLFIHRLNFLPNGLVDLALFIVGLD